MAIRREKGYEIDMCSGAILPKLLQFTLPLMFSSILQLLFNAADIIVVGHFAGDDSLAAVGSNTSIINLLVNLFIGLSVGANILAARYYGANEKENLRQTVHTSILLAIISGIALTLVGVLGAKTILTWMRSSEDVRDLATLYLKIYFLGMPATMLYNFGAALLRAVGDTRRPLLYLSFSGAVNVVLNLYFVVWLHLDVAGVALATIISQYISAFLIIRCMTLEKGGVHLELRQLRIYPSRLKQILQVGLPAGFQGVLFSFANVFIQRSVNSFGKVVMAGNAAASNIETFVYTAVNSFYQATISFVSQNYGAGRYERIQPILIRVMGCVLVIGIGLGRLTVYFGPQLLRLYSDNDAVIAAGMERVTLLCSLYVLCGIMDVLPGALRGLGYSILPMIVSLIGACGLRLVWLATIFQIPAYHTIRTLYWSYPISWTVTALAHLVCYILAMRRLKCDLDNEKTLCT